MIKLISFEIGSVLGYRAQYKRSGWQRWQTVPLETLDRRVQGVSQQDCQRGQSPYVGNVRQGKDSEQGGGKLSRFVLENKSFTYLAGR